MSASQSSVISEGFGTWGSISLIVANGFGLSSAPSNGASSVISEGFGTWGSVGLIITNGFGFASVQPTNPTGIAGSPVFSLFSMLL